MAINLIAVRPVLATDQNKLLLRAVAFGNAAKTKAALRKGADPDTRDGNGNTVLMKMTKKGYTRIAKILIFYDADVNAQNKLGETALILAAEGHIKIMRVLLSKGADPNARSKDGTTPLMRAADKGSLYIVKLLLEHGADVNTRDHKGRTPLWFAQKKQKKEIIKLLEQYQK
ncbi:MAG: ankyrin repeat domain-containing protein [bacterium]